MEVDVKIGGRYIPCTLAGKSTCKLCGNPIVWARKPNGKFTPVDPKELEPGVMESHFGHCEEHSHTRQRPREQPPAPRPSRAGIEMTEAVWRQLLRLIHPDKHHGGADERLANDLTRWLIEQRARLKRT